METVLRSWLCLPEGTKLVAVETKAAKGGLERGWKEALGSAWQDFVCSEEKAPGTARVAECGQKQQLGSSRKAGGS